MSAVPVVAGRRRPGLARHHPEPARFWLAFVPRAWPAVQGPWTDLGGARLRSLRGSGANPDASLPTLDATELDDLLYVPPVAAELAHERDRWVASLIDSETPVLVQLQPGDETATSDALVVIDLLPALLTGDLKRLESLPAGAFAVWPLIAGVTDSSELCQEGCSALAGVGVAGVQPLTVELSAEQRRWLAEQVGESAFEALFHGPPPSERDFARCASGYGFEVLLPRPSVAGKPFRVRNRRLAADLALTGDLWLRLGRSVATGQELLRAARRADETRRDLAALAREGNLGVLDWLDGRSIDLIAESVAVGHSSLLRDMLAEYLKPLDS